jgi:metal-responsive CopG/Arc/MetJ family transcriptional regulator
MAKPAQITVRVEEELLERIDAIVEQMRSPLLEPRRSDIIRACLERGLPLVEAEAKAQKRRR